MESLFPFQEMRADVKEILDKETLPKEVYSYLEGSDLPLFQWTVIDVVTRIRFIALGVTRSIIRKGHPEDNAFSPASS